MKTVRVRRGRRSAFAGISIIWPLASQSEESGQRLFCPRGKRDNVVGGAAMGVHRWRKESPHTWSERSLAKRCQFLITSEKLYLLKNKFVKKCSINISSN